MIVKGIEERVVLICALICVLICALIVWFCFPPGSEYKPSLV